MSVKLSAPMIKALEALADDASATIATSTAVALIKREMITTQQTTDEGQTYHTLLDAGYEAIGIDRPHATVSMLDAAMVAGESAREPLPVRAALMTPARVATLAMSPLRRATAYAAMNARNGLRVTSLTPAQRRRTRKAENKIAGRSL